MHVKLLSIKDRDISDAAISAILVHLKDKIEKNPQFAKILSSKHPAY